MACTCCLRGATGLTLADFALLAVADCACTGGRINICAIPASSTSRIPILLDFMMCLLADFGPVSELEREERVRSLCFVVACVARHDVGRLRTVAQASEEDAVILLSGGERVNR